MEEYKCIDINRKWNGYGRVQDISDLNKNELAEKAKRFSEGLPELENLLNTIWKLGIKTVACCRGQHISIDASDLPIIRTSFYVMFFNTDWCEYLSLEIINNKDTYISDKSIHYYGENIEEFVKKLEQCFIDGKKENKNELNKVIDRETPLNVRVECIKKSLYKLGFTNDQIQILSNLYKEVRELNKSLQKEKKHENDKILNNKILEYQNTLKKIIEENNKKLS